MRLHVHVSDACFNYVPLRKNTEKRGLAELKSRQYTCSHSIYSCSCLFVSVASLVALSQVDILFGWFCRFEDVVSVEFSRTGASTTNRFFAFTVSCRGGVEHEFTSIDRNEYTVRAQ